MDITTRSDRNSDQRDRSSFGMLHAIWDVKVPVIREHAYRKACPAVWVADVNFAEQNPVFLLSRRHRNRDVVATILQCCRNNITCNIAASSMTYRSKISTRHILMVATYSHKSRWGRGGQTKSQQANTGTQTVPLKIFRRGRRGRCHARSHARRYWHYPWLVIGDCLQRS